MRSRSPLIILLIGICGLAAFGMATKVALDGSDELKSLARFKIGVIESFAPRGVTEVSARFQGEPRGTRLLLTVSSPDVVDAALEDDIARFWLTHFPRATGVLSLEFATGASWFSSPEPFRVEQIGLAEFRATEQRNAAIAELRADAAAICDGAEIVSLDLGDRVVTVQVLAPPEFATGDLLARTARECVERLRVERRSKLRIERVARRPAGAAGDGHDQSSWPVDVLDAAWFDYRARPTAAMPERD